MKKINYYKLPAHIQNGVQRYIEQGIHPGDFLTAVICNDFLQSVLRAGNFLTAYDIINILKFFHDQAPADCWGSGKKMTEWMKQKRLEQIKQKKADLSSISKEVIE